MTEQFPAAEPSSSMPSLFGALTSGQTLRRDLLLLAIISVIVGLIAFVLLFLLYTFAAPGLLQIPDDTAKWGYLEGVVGLAALAVVLGGLIFTLVAYSNDAGRRDDERRSACINMYKEIYDRLMNDRDVQARRWIIINLRPLHLSAHDQLTDPHTWAETIAEKQVREPVGQAAPNDVNIQPQVRREIDWLQGTHAKIHASAIDAEGATTALGHEYVKHVLNTLDFLGFVHANYWSLDNEFAEWMSLPIVKVWRRIGPYIEWEARARNETEDFYHAARELGEYCLRWRVEHNKPESEIMSRGL